MKDSLRLLKCELSERVGEEKVDKVLHNLGLEQFSYMDRIAELAETAKLSPLFENGYRNVKQLRLEVRGY
jgi:hypothetical protein